MECVLSWFLHKIQRDPQFLFLMFVETSRSNIVCIHIVYVLYIIHISAVFLKILRRITVTVNCIGLVWYSHAATGSCLSNSKIPHCLHTLCTCTLYMFMLSFLLTTCEGTTMFCVVQSPNCPRHPVFGVSRHPKTRNIGSYIVYIVRHILSLVFL